MNWVQFEQGWRLAPRTEPARSLVVLLHGVGSNARDLLPLADAWAGALPTSAFASFDASEPFDGGFGGRQWFSLNEVREDNRVARVAAGYPALAAMLAAELGHWNLTADRLALVGFSQGTMMALHHAAHHPHGAAAVVGYSGRLSSQIKSDGAAPGTSRASITLVHGTADPVIPVGELATAAEAFKAAGYAVDAHVQPGVVHTISAEGSALGLRALQRALDA